MATTQGDIAETEYEANQKILQLVWELSLKFTFKPRYKKENVITNKANVPVKLRDYKILRSFWKNIFLKKIINEKKFPIKPGFIYPLAAHIN